MGQPNEHDPVLLLSAVFSRYPEAHAWARKQMESHWGPVKLESPVFRFEETAYYEPTMGPALDKQFLAFERLISPTDLVDVKLATNAWEEEYARLGRHPESRPLNLDPGYLTPAKLILASTKDHTHRIYLERGIFAEITLYYKDKAWQSGPWTFPNYKRADYHEFFTRCRQDLRARGK
jgi:hypothetical protein